MIEIRPEGSNSAAKHFQGDTGRIAFSGRYGFVCEPELYNKLKLRHRKGLSLLEDNPALFSFHFSQKDGVTDCDACQADEQNKTWRVESPHGAFLVRHRVDKDIDPATLFTDATTPPKTSGRPLWIAGLSLLFTLLLIQYFVASSAATDPLISQEMAEKVEESTAIDKRDPVRIVQVPLHKVRMAFNQPTPTAKIAGGNPESGMQKSKGFSGLVGSPLLKSVLGGAPLDPNASAGAGAGGTQGSGGETLTGIGKGLRRTTVGNTGLAGLGGVGTKGRGGGGGGYGTEFVGQGNGVAGAPSLSKISLSDSIYLDGGLDKGAISSTVVKHLNEVRACYEKALAAIPGLSGQVHMYFEVGARGQVLQTRVEKTSLNNAGVESCIAGRLKTWTFPEPVGNVVVKVTYPFLLRPTKS